MNLKLSKLMQEKIIKRSYDSNKKKLQSNTNIRKSIKYHSHMYIKIKGIGKVINQILK